MTILRSAPMRLPRKVLPLAVAALLFGSLPLLAGQEFSRPSDSSDVGRSFEPPSVPDAPAPSIPDAPSVSSEPSTPSEPSVSSEPSEPSTPSEASQEPVLLAANRSRPSDSSDTGRTAHESGSRGSSSSSASGGGSSSGSGRTAHPTSPGAGEPHRQPPSRGSRGHNGGFHGGYYGSYGYPYGFYGPYGYWPSLSWWWGGFWGWDYPYYGGYGYGHGQPGYYGRGGDLGALDLDVEPGRTEVYVDGEYLGKVDAFDGWPRYLWLPRGTYDVVFYLDGFKTIARQITVYPGTVIDIDDRMEPGTSTRPEDLASKSHERRDSRLQYENERRERIERGEPTDEDNWRDRMRRERGTMRDDDRDRDDHEMDRDDDREEVEIPADTQGKGRLRLEVEPEDASVYVDGRFVGTGTELGLMRGGLPLAPGEHRLAVVRPGRKAEERDFKVEPGADIKLDVELEAN